MTPNVKLMFEVESLDNASPATVSRAGVVYVSDTDLDWPPILTAFLPELVPTAAAALRELFVSVVAGDEAEGLGLAAPISARKRATPPPSKYSGACAVSSCDPRFMLQFLLYLRVRRYTHACG